MAPNQVHFASSRLLYVHEEVITGRTSAPVYSPIKQASLHNRLSPLSGPFIFAQARAVGRYKTVQKGIILR